MVCQFRHIIGYGQNSKHLQHPMISQSDTHSGVVLIRHKNPALCLKLMTASKTPKVKKLDIESSIYL